MKVSVEVISIDVDYKLQMWTVKVLPIMGYPEIGLSLYAIDYYSFSEFGVINKIEKIEEENCFLLYIDIKYRNKNFEIFKIDAQKGDLLFVGQSTKVILSLNINDRINAFLEVLNFSTSDKVKAFVKNNLMIGANAIIESGNEKIGLSKIGGLPIGKLDFKFPKDENEKSMMFLGQIAIQELLRDTDIDNPFPIQQGILYIFSSTSVHTNPFDTYETFKKINLIYSEYIEDLKICDLPQDLEDYGYFDEHYIEFVNSLSIPSLESGLTLLQKFNKKEIEDLEFIIGALRVYNTPNCIEFIGHPREVQNCIINEASELLNMQLDQIDTINNKNSKNFYSDWIQLMSFYPDNYFQKLSSLKKNIVFNDIEAKLYLMIRKEDIKILDFSKLQTVGQST
jgi:Domain of unknown function (DUF1963)